MLDSRFHECLRAVLPTESHLVPPLRAESRLADVELHVLCYGIRRSVNARRVRRRRETYR